MCKLKIKSLVHPQYWHIFLCFFVPSLESRESRNEKRKLMAKTLQNIFQQTPATFKHSAKSKNEMIIVYQRVKDLRNNTSNHRCVSSRCPRPIRTSWNLKIHPLYHIFDKTTLNPTCFFFKPWFPIVFTIPTKKNTQQNNLVSWFSLVTVGWLWSQITNQGSNFSRATFASSTFDIFTSVFGSTFQAAKRFSWLVNLPPPNVPPPEIRA